ncbi:MAG: ATP-binding cassette domain-containing protein [Bifidobacteriaceae bacterium]|jgi:iron complex transport system ATP-binding protein|nr:ATP-binding cassette domain-containing protein [Bifidobacteriaceae bacterium]
MLEARGLGHRYGAGSWLFRDLDLTVAGGEVLAVLGPNARGKTTLLTCLAGLRRPKEGTARCEGGVGYVPQSHDSQHRFAVLDMVAMGRARLVRSWTSPGAQDLEAAWKAMARVGIDDLAERPYAALSGGQRQLVLIARALVCDPSVLILDEPCAALDLRNQRAVLLMVDDLSREGIGIVMTTHDPGHALSIATQAILMDAETISCGRACELVNGQTLTELYRTPIHATTVMAPFGERAVVVADFGAGRGAARTVQQLTHTEKGTVKS